MYPSIVRTPSTGCNPLPYSAVPHDMLRDHRLIGTDVRLVGILLVYAKNKDFCWPSVATLARDMDCCERTVQLSLRRLKDAGWIGERPSGNPTGRVLVLLWRCTPAPGATPTTGGAQLPYTQGLPRPGRVSARPVAPEGIPEKEKVAPLPRGKPEPMTAAELREYLAPWLSEPESSPQYKLAVRQLLARGIPVET